MVMGEIVPTRFRQRLMVISQKNFALTFVMAIHLTGQADQNHTNSMSSQRNRSSGFTFNLSPIIAD